MLNKEFVEPQLICWPRPSMWYQQQWEELLFATKLFLKQHSAMVKLRDEYDV